MVIDKDDKMENEEEEKNQGKKQDEGVTLFNGYVPVAMAQQGQGQTVSAVNPPVSITESESDLNQTLDTDGEGSGSRSGSSHCLSTNTSSSSMSSSPSSSLCCQSPLRTPIKVYIREVLLPPPEPEQEQDHSSSSQPGSASSGPNGENDTAADHNDKIPTFFIIPMDGLTVQFQDAKKQDVGPLSHVVIEMGEMTTMKTEQNKYKRWLGRSLLKRRLDAAIAAAKVNWIGGKWCLRGSQILAAYIPRSIKKRRNRSCHARLMFNVRKQISQDPTTKDANNNCTGKQYHRKTLNILGYRKNSFMNVD